MLPRSEKFILGPKSSQIEKIDKMAISGSKPSGQVPKPGVSRIRPVGLRKVGPGGNPVWAGRIWLFSFHSFFSISFLLFSFHFFFLFWERSQSWGRRVRAICDRSLSSRSRCCWFSYFNSRSRCWGRILTLVCDQTQAARK